MNCVAEWDRPPGLSLGFALPGQARRPVLLLVLLALASTPALPAQWGGELRFCIRSEPRSFHPALADSDAAETIRYLTGGGLGGGKPGKKTGKGAGGERGEMR